MSRLNELPFRLPKPFDRLYDARIIVPGLLLLETGLCEAIIRRVRYTEIDWKAYMTQSATYLAGERDYSAIKGETGPLVYPLGHVHAYNALNLLTDGGKDIRLAQQIFGGLYVLAVGCFLLVLTRCKSVPLWAYPLISLSKRLHSIFVLRMFNDGIALVVMNLALLTASYRSWRMTSIIWAVALSIKMNMLLYAPALALLIVLDAGLVELVLSGALVLLVQVYIGLPVLRQYPKQYIAGAFDLSRSFLYEWTVNWRMLPEATFLSRRFHVALLVLHLQLLLVLAWRVCQPHGGVQAVISRALRAPTRAAGLTSPKAEDIVVTLCTANLIGIVCARSLHYQFFAWYAQQLVLLLWRSGFSFPIKLILLIASEWCWNVFPSTVESSTTLLLCNATLLIGLLSRRDGLTKETRRTLQPTTKKGRPKPA